MFIYSICVQEQIFFSLLPFSLRKFIEKDIVLTAFYSATKLITINQTSILLCFTSLCDSFFRDCKVVLSPMKLLLSYNNKINLKQLNEENCNFFILQHTLKCSFSNDFSAQHVFFHPTFIQHCLPVYHTN